MALSPDEERHIKNLSVIPAAIVVYVFIGYFLYLVHINSSLSFLFCVAYSEVTFSLAMPLALFLGETIIISRKTKRPIASYAKRFFGQMSLAIVASIMFWIIFGPVYLMMSSLLDASVLLVLVGAIWFVLWGILVFRYKERFGKLFKGDW